MLSLGSLSSLLCTLALGAAPLLLGTADPAASALAPTAEAAACPNTEIYCTAKIDSQGCEPQLSFSGCPSASAGQGFVVTISRVINTPSFGVLMYSVDAAANIPFQGGFLCVQPPIQRPPPKETPGSGGIPCSGVFRFDFNAWISSGNDPSLVAGKKVWLQYFYFDPGTGEGGTIGLSRGIATEVGI